MNPGDDERGGGPLTSDPTRRPATLLTRGLRWAPATLVSAFALWLLWPVPTGRMPLSADHTVHLSRAWMVGQELRHGRLGGWSEQWSFGFPLGELYPPLADLAVVAIHTLGASLLDWQTAYAIAFTIAFALQGWVLLRLGRALDLGPLPGLVAGLLVLADPGFSREGGWMYTVYFGVWPQALATSLVWLGFAELTPPRNAAQPDASAPAGTSAATRLARAALCFGGGLLAHPMALMMLVLGAPLYVLTVGTREPSITATGHTSAAGDARRLGGLRACLARVALACTLGFALAAWWWLPMLAHKGWMASYGWLFASFADLVRWALAGRWAQRMPAAVGYLAFAGIVWAALRGSGFARFAAAFALIQWVCASSDLAWGLRLDRVSEGFTHLQYQRFLIAAKPGFYLAAGTFVGVIANLGATLLRANGPLARLTGGRRAAVGGGLLVGVAVALVWLAGDVRRGMREHEVGVVQLEHVAGDAAFDADYRDFLVWARARWEERTADYRIAFRVVRNVHWFMDSTPWTHTPLHKIGFTPGDNFVHKPESGRAEVLDALRVRYLVSRSTRERPLAREVARFGSIRVVERELPATTSIAWLRDLDEGVPATVTRVAGSPAEGRLEVEVRGLGERDAELVFAIAGYPRWHASSGELYEVPVFGGAPSASFRDRAAGALRGGKALGDDGSEPTLLATRVTGDGRVTLAYDGRRPRDLAAALLSAATLLVLLLLAIARGPTARLRGPVIHGFQRCTALVARAAHPIVLGLAVLAGIGAAGQRWWSARAREQAQAVGWLDAGRAVDIHGAHVGALKTDMLVRPAVLLRRSRDSSITFPELKLASHLRGWIAVDDDDAQTRARGQVRLRIEARRPGGAWSTLFEMPVPHRPNRLPLDIDTGGLAGERVDLRVQGELEGERSPRIGFDLELGEAR